jgi:MFS family permease
MDLKTDKTAAKISLGKLRTFDSFNVPSFRLFFGSLLGQWLAFSMQNVVNTLLLYRLTDSAFLVGILAVAYYTPVLLLSVLGGAIADRIPKKYLLILSRLATGSAMLVIALSLTFGYLDKSHTGS